MLSKLYALLTDTYATDARIYVFRDRRMAEEALRSKEGQGAAIVPFIADDLLEGATTGLVYLAMTMEDTGARIHAAFRSMFGLRAYMLEHVSESPCLPVTGWLDPAIKDGRLVEEFHIGPQLAIAGTA